MKLNKFKVSAIFYFKSGISKKVDWIEERLVKKVETEEEVLTQPLTLDEADAFFQGKFKKWKEEAATVVRKNAKGETSIIPFGEVEYITVVVNIVGDDVGSIPGERVNSNENVPVPPTPSVKNIQDHPAFKK